MNPGPTLARRLTRFEFDNTINDLLGAYLSTEMKTLAKTTFPVEERRHGFDNNAEALTVSPLLGEQYLLSAERIAATAVDANLAGLLSMCTPTPGNEDMCAERFFERFGRKAYRRPPSKEELEILRSVYKLGKETSFATGIKLALATMLQSPRFLYRIEFGVPAKPGESVVKLDQWEIASRLSYLLWGSTPDGDLLTAAEQGRLGTKDEVSLQVQRMLKDPKKTQSVVKNFHNQWLELHHLEKVEKDTKVFPKWNAGLIGLFHGETERFLDEVVWKGGGDVASLFTAPYTFADQNLAKFYGLPYPTTLGMDGKPITTFQKIDLDGKTRAGLLTQGSILALFANANQTSPVLRGKFVREQLLCHPLPPPPENVSIELPPLDPKLTTRERFNRHAEDAACVGCHTLMDPIGLGFEQFDGIGLHRPVENGRAVDASGEVHGIANGKFNGLVELGQKLGASDEVQSCVALKWFQYAYGREYEAANGDECTLERIKRRFADGGYKIKDLLVALTESDAFLYRRIVTPGGAQ